MAKPHTPLGDIVKELIKDFGSKKRISEEDVADAWARAAGEAAARHSRPVSLRKSTLVVNVDGSSWLYELTTRKREILGRIEGFFKGKKIKDIRFRIGDIGRR